MPFFLILAFLFLILHPGTSFAGIKDGLELWFQIVLPTLFPFLILIGLMLSYHVPETVGKWLSPFLPGSLFREAYCFPCMVGLLSGYPSGAKTLNDMVVSGSLSKEEGEWLLCFCNNVSPAFFLNFVFVQKIPVGNLRFVLLLILYLAAFLSSLPFYPRKKKANSPEVPDPSAGPQISPAPRKTLDDILTSACEILVKVGCYIMLFSLLCRIAGQYLAAFPLLKLLFTGCLEITNGIASLQSLPAEHPLLLPLAMAFCGFGGLSALFQSFSVVQAAKLSKTKYAISKLLNMALCTLFTFLLIFHTL